MSSQTKIELQADILPIRTELEPNDSDTLHNISTCRAVLHNRVAKALNRLPDTTIQHLALMRRLPLLSLSRRRMGSQTRRPKMALRLMVLKPTKEVFLILVFVVL